MKSNALPFPFSHIQKLTEKDTEGENRGKKERLRKMCESEEDNQEHLSSSQVFRAPNQSTATLTS